MLIEQSQGMLELAKERLGEWERKMASRKGSTGQEEEREKEKKNMGKVQQIVFQDDCNKITHATCSHSVTLTFLTLQDDICISFPWIWVGIWLQQKWCYAIKGDTASTWLFWDVLRAQSTMTKWRGHMKRPHVHVLANSVRSQITWQTYEWRYP